LSPLSETLVECFTKPLSKGPLVTSTKFPQSQARLFCLENASFMKSESGGQQRESERTAPWIRCSHIFGPVNIVV